ncbi:hypothetical protein JCM16303_003362 [Sporobolomyces ruberrimus]
MSSTTPTNDPISESKCCLCGAASTQRCSSCAKFDFDVFFCSREHQKLLWPAHRHVCGQSSKRFLWPRLTDEEADTFQGANWIPVVASGFLEKFDVEPQDVVYTINSLRKSYAGPPLGSPNTEQAMLISLRALRYDDFRRKMKMKEMSLRAVDECYDKLMASPQPFVFDRLAYYVRNDLPFLENSMDQTWWGPLLHKWLCQLVSSFLFTRGADRGVRRAEAVKFSTWTTAQCAEFVNREILTIDPQGAEKLKRRFAELVVFCQVMDLGSGQGES